MAVKAKPMPDQIPTQSGAPVGATWLEPPAKQPPFVPRTDFGKKVKAHTRYYTADGLLVPGVTGVLKVLNKPELIPWANKLGLQGVDSAAYTAEAAMVGTLAHALIEAHLNGEIPDLSDFSPAQLERAQHSLKAFIEWKGHHLFEAVLIEASLVSEEYGFGGTVDCVAVLDDVLTLLDFKTSSGIFKDHFYQVSAYWKLLAENGHAVKGVRILRIGRTEGEGMEEHILTGKQVLHGWQVFEQCLRLWRLLKS